MAIDVNLRDIQTGFLTAAAYTENNTLIEQALQKALNLEGGANNEMLADLDMGLNQINNLADATEPHQAINKQVFDNLAQSFIQDAADQVTLAEAQVTLAEQEADRAQSEANSAEGFASSASSSASSASGFATAASNSADAAATSAQNVNDVETVVFDRVDDFLGVYYGSLAAEPTVDPLGNPIDKGDLYYNNVDNLLYVYDGSTWTTTTGDIPSHLAEPDPHPQYQFDFTITTDQTGELSSYDCWLADVLLTTQTRNLPASPADGDEVKIVDNQSNSDVNNITVGRNGNLIMGLAEDLNIDKKGAVVILKYVSSAGDWRLV